MNDIWRLGICCGGGEEGRTLGRAAGRRLEAAEQEVFGGTRTRHPRGLAVVIVIIVVMK